MLRIKCKKRGARTLSKTCPRRVSERMLADLEKGHWEKGRRRAEVGESRKRSGVGDRQVAGLGQGGEPGWRPASPPVGTGQLG